MERLPLNRQLSLLHALVKQKFIRPEGKPAYLLLIENQRLIRDSHILEHIAACFTEIPDYPKNQEEARLREKILKEYLDAGYTREQFIEMFGGGENRAK